jgi:hypothetical protein
VDDAVADRSAPRVAVDPVLQVAGGHDVDVTLQHQRGFGIRLAPPAENTDDAVALVPLRLDAGEVGVGVELIEVELPGVDVEPQLAQLPGVPVLEVGFGVGAGDAGGADQVDELVDEGLLVDRVEDALLCCAGAHEKTLRHRASSSCSSSMRAGSITRSSATK